MLSAQTFSRNLEWDWRRESTQPGRTLFNMSFKRMHQEHSKKRKRDVCLQNQHVHKTWIERSDISSIAGMHLPKPQTVYWHFTLCYKLNPWF